MPVALVLAVTFGLLALLGAETFRPIGCPSCGDPLTDHLQSLQLMPDYCPKCGWRIS